VDQSFVAGLGATNDALTIVRAVIGLAHGLGLTAVAEGVETAAQVRHLIDLDCDVAQGFHFGRPAAADALRLGRPEPTVPGTRGARRLALAQPDDLAPRR
jgi:EAL domain-containing protein (putative c-di-GMP-specific phosphodiesterase class I)